MVIEQTKVNREYKDRLFKLIFREKRDLMQLYNAINDTDYDNPEDFEVLCENREEVCSMLLTEYDEQAHIESEKEIAKEEGQERVCTLIQKMVEAGKGNQLAKLSDSVFLQEMFEYFQI